MNSCPNCHAQIKAEGFRSNNFLTEERVRFINEFSDEKQEAYCEKCERVTFEASSRNLQQEYRNTKDYISQHIHLIPVISIHTPYNWEYEVLGLVTGQTTTGTGVVAEFKSGFTDLFGKQSGAYNKKLAQGEQMALNQLRAKTIGQGGNAVIAIDLDYAEVGASKGMLMVCATGTAVKLSNVGILSEEFAIELSKLLEKTDRLAFLEKNFGSYIEYV